MNPLTRYFIEIAYNGTAYHGWQTQKNANSVQEVLNKALSTICREHVETLGCGRTDTGVHARQLFAHFDLASETNVLDPRFLLSLNSLLPYDISAKAIFPVKNDAHARFDAINRSYEYHIHFKKDPFKHNLSWLLRDIPDIELMNQAAGIIMEYTDFSCFSKSNTQTFTNNCTISKAEWTHSPGGMIFHISADRFLRNMVRAIVGTLMKVGKKEIQPEEIRMIIESKDRSNAGESVPACGLFLTEVHYPYITSNQ
ncbi:MAG: tRNA pseudouridine(38-40) synthase TruA [Daejeonella sp.]|uniref:tRNA pseudouridine(38-40) synthase TruA n=1 Tax=Daejeonella sp. TaxID=2805397 RepID=UPI003C795110